MLIALIQSLLKKRRAKKLLQDGQDPAAVLDACSHGVHGPCPECKASTRAARIYRARIIAGLVFPFALQALDTTLVATALATIAEDFDKVSELNWIVAAFTLTSAAFIPFWGQMADVFGRHAAVQACTWMVIIGSAICTGAPTSVFPLFLVGRGLQGLGCAGVNVVTRIIIADKVSLQENTKNMGIFSMFAGIAFGIGPVIGGYLTEANWRWCFAINLPVGVVGSILIFFVLRKELLGPQPLASSSSSSHDQTPDEHDLQPPPTHRDTYAQRIKTIDFGGQLLFLFGFALLVLALTWGGGDYAWATPNVLAPLVIGIVLVLAFFGWEFLLAPGRALARKLPAARAMVPWSVAAVRDVPLLAYVQFSVGMSMNAALYFCSLYFSWVMKSGSDEAGKQLLYYVPGLGVGVYSGFLLFKVLVKRSWYVIFVGSLIQAVGVGILALGLYHEHMATIAAMMALVGVGNGMRFFIVPLHGIALFRRNIASIVPLLAVAVPLGGTLSITLMSTVLNNKTGGLTRQFEDISQLSGGGNVSATQMLEIRSQVKMGIVWAFVAIVPFMVVDVLCALMMGNVKLTAPAKGGGGGEGAEQYVVESGVYLMGLFGKKGKEEREKAGEGEREPMTAQNEVVVQRLDGEV